MGAVEHSEPAERYIPALGGVPLGGGMSASARTKKYCAGGPNEHRNNQTDKRANDPRPGTGKYATLLHYTHPANREQLLRDVAEAFEIEGNPAELRERAKDLITATMFEEDDDGTYREAGKFQRRLQSWCRQHKGDASGLKGFPQLLAYVDEFYQARRFLLGRFPHARDFDFDF